MELLQHLPDFNFDQSLNVLRQEDKIRINPNLSLTDFNEAGPLVIPSLSNGHSSLFFQNETSIER